MQRAKLSNEPYITHQIERFIQDITPKWLQLYCFKKSTQRYDFLCTNLRGFEKKVSPKTSHPEGSIFMEEFGFWIGGGTGIASIALSSYQGLLRINVFANAEKIRDASDICAFFEEEIGKLVSAVELESISRTSSHLKKSQ
jgi:hypothetical protein